MNLNWFKFWERKTITIDDRLRGAYYGYRNISPNTLSHDGFESCSTAYRCIDLISTLISTLPIEPVDADGKTIEGGPVYDRWNNPNSLFNRMALIKLWATHLLLFGEASWFGNTIEDRLIEILPLDAGSIKPIWGSRIGELIGYSYNGRDSFLPEQVFYSWFPNPRLIYQPNSPLKAAAREVDVINESLKWDYNLISSGARPPLVIRMKDESSAGIDEEAANELKKIIEREHLGSDNAGKVLVLRWPGLVAEPLAFSPSDLQSLEKLSLMNISIANVYGVPPELVGGQKTYENFGVAKSFLYETVILPIADSFCTGLTNWSLWGLNLGEKFSVIRSKVPILRADTIEESTRLNGLVVNGILTRNEARKKLNEEPSTDPLADILTTSQPVYTLAASDLSVEDGGGL